LFAIAPLAYAANPLLILAPVSGAGATLCLLTYCVLFGFNSIGMAFASTHIIPKSSGMHDQSRQAAAAKRYHRDGRFGLRPGAALGDSGRRNRRPNLIHARRKNDRPEPSF
jgi:hypothetical protein